MGYASASYQRAHTEVKRVRGNASTHTCPCGKPASDWAYQFSGDVELRSEDGSRRYSRNPEDYLAMCRSCHIRFDIENDPAMAEKRRGGVLRANTTVIQCIVCGLTSNRGGMGNHQKHSGHQGFAETGRKELS